MVEMGRKVAYREGVGDLLAEGIKAWPPSLKIRRLAWK
ncbi:MAG: aldehyde ferredoxin oxidoreductase C-terminal domain-containing protein [Chloroflexi bacterium]|nr:aldehyde ferredoxin oxidoreductase C-terminal domain-containing protein [Chloroflexota bacterium]